MNGKPMPSQYRPQGEDDSRERMTGNAPQKTICVMIGDVSYEFSAELMKGYFDRPNGRACACC